jgi:hypothetical protein
MIVILQSTRSTCIREMLFATYIVKIHYMPFHAKWIAGVLAAFLDLAAVTFELPCPAFCTAHPLDTALLLGCRNQMLLAVFPTVSEDGCLEGCVIVEGCDRRMRY